MEPAQSTPRRLAFDVTVPIGEFTVCFCESGCASVEDFALEVGRVVSSCVACLLDPGHGQCEAMAAGGLRCGSDLFGV